MIRIEPDWVGELLGQWAGKDWSDAQQELGYPTVSPMFAKAVGSSFELEDVTGYSHAELRAMVAAVDWLQLHHADHWRALSREFRAWSRSTLEEKPGDRERVLEAGRMLANYIDNVLG
jgi:hypothetical protein